MLQLQLVEVPLCYASFFKASEAQRSAPQCSSSCGRSVATAKLVEGSTSSLSTSSSDADARLALACLHLNSEGLLFHAKKAMKASRKMKRANRYLTTPRALRFCGRRSDHRSSQDRELAWGRALCVGKFTEKRRGLELWRLQFRSLGPTLECSSLRC